jgi:arylsulfatase A
MKSQNLTLNLGNSMILIGSMISVGVTGQHNSLASSQEPDPPNFIIIFADDMGYGDIGAFGHPTIKTPNLDKMAYESQRWTNFYVAAPVCTPSRAGLLTGRLPVRTGMCSEKRRVLFPDSKGGLPEKELTIASVLNQKGYVSACIGKWHLGHLPQYSPNAHGFDYYYGIPYSNDMDMAENLDRMEANFHPEIDYFNVPLMRNMEIIERPADQTTITRRYTQEAVKFIEQNKNSSFFLYLAHSMPHVPLFRSPEFENQSLRGIYGDVIEELDWSVGEILKTVIENGLDKNTIVVFTSDNGPWTIFKQHGGSSGLLSGGKGGTFEGGMREPTIMWSPGLIKPGVIMELGTTMDLLPTFCSLADIDLPADRIYDGYDISPVLLGTGHSARDVVIYYRDTEVFAVRKGAYKAHFIVQSDYGTDKPVIQDPPLLFNLNTDPSEKYNIAGENPEVIEEIRVILQNHKTSVIPVENQLEK